MSYTINPRIERTSWDYISRDDDKSIMAGRTLIMSEFAWMEDKDFILSFRDPVSRAFTPWKPYYGTDDSLIMRAWDIHRSVMHNEIIAESDYPTYDQNLDAAKILGQMLEERGFTPNYWFSGNKSIHISILFDFKSLCDVGVEVQEKVMGLLSRGWFVNKFMKFIRNKVISCFGTKVREFDGNFVNSRHLIRAELSRNSLGFKTFLGNSWKDLPVVPEVCNEMNRIRPRWAIPKVSRPNKEFLQAILEEFVASEESKVDKRKKSSRNASLTAWMGIPGGKDSLRPCIVTLLGHREFNDGCKRAAFIISNELKAVKGNHDAFGMMQSWAEATGVDLSLKEIENMVFRKKCYSIGCESISQVLDAAGLSSICTGCERFK